jgi:hypothetical protein
MRTMNRGWIDGWESRDSDERCGAGDSFGAGERESERGLWGG